MTKCKNQNQEKGLYQQAYEHDACGVGMVVNIHGNKSHELVDNALKVLENMEHRGAETRDKTGDGAGIMVQIPHEFILLQGIPVPEKGKYARKREVWYRPSISSKRRKNPTGNPKCHD